MAEIVLWKDWSHVTLSVRLCVCLLGLTSPQDDRVSLRAQKTPSASPALHLFFFPLVILSAVCFYLIVPSDSSAKKKKLLEGSEMWSQWFR